MSKRTILLAMTALFLLIGLSQSVMAKKVVYLGHQYKGKVNNEDVPEGKGEINIDGVIINGIFNGSTITNATHETSWLKYEGEVTFYDSNKITFKKGGLFTRYYYNSDDVRGVDIKTGRGCVYPSELAKVRKEISNLLEEDYTIENNESLFSNLEITTPIEMTYVPAELNPPVAQVKMYVPLKRFDRWDTTMNRVNGYLFLYIAPSDYFRNGFKDYKDSEGRVWDYEYNQGYKVTYPDESFASNKTNGKIVNPNKSYYINDYSWKIDYPNGDQIRRYSGDKIVVSLKDKKCFFIVYESIGDALGVEDVINGNTNKLILKTKYPSSFRMGVFDADDIPEAELHSIIKEKVLPYFSFPQKDVAIDFYYSRDKETYNTRIEERNFISSYGNGIYKTKAGLEKESKKEALAKRQELNKKYGKTYVDAIYNNRLIVGMPIKLLVNDTPWVNVYKMHVYNGGESGDFKVVIMVEGKTKNGWTSGSGVYYKKYRIWVKNWKITKFSDWTNVDEREFNRL